eukprot:4622910-Amphidinium_carterae.1
MPTWLGRWSKKRVLYYIITDGLKPAKKTRGRTFHRLSMRLPAHLFRDWSGRSSGHASVECKLAFETVQLAATSFLCWDFNILGEEWQRQKHRSYAA